MLTSNDEFDFSEKLKYIYQVAFLELVQRNIMYEPGSCIDCPEFVSYIKSTFEELL